MTAEKFSVRGRKRIKQPLPTHHSAHQKPNQDSSSGLVLASLADLVRKNEGKSLTENGKEGGEKCQKL